MYKMYTLNVIQSSVTCVRKVQSDVIQMYSWTFILRINTHYTDFISCLEIQRKKKAMGKFVRFVTFLKAVAKALALACILLVRY